MSAPGNREEPRRYLVEGIIIVLSILLALAVDAAWEDYQERQLEQEYLVGLAAEFRSCAMELQSDQERRQTIMALGGEILAQDGAQPQSFTGRDLNTLLDYRFYTPSHSFLEDLVSSGNLHLIQSHELRMALLDYVQERDRLQVVERRELDFVADHLEPLVASHVDLPKLLGDAPADGLAELLVNQQFRNLLWIRWERTETSVRFGNTVEKTIIRVQQEIEKARNGA